MQRPDISSFLFIFNRGELGIEGLKQAGSGGEFLLRSIYLVQADVMLLSALIFLGSPALSSLVPGMDKTSSTPVAHVSKIFCIASFLKYDALCWDPVWKLNSKHPIPTYRTIHLHFPSSSSQGGGTDVNHFLIRLILPHICLFVCA